MSLTRTLASRAGGPLMVSALALLATIQPAHAQSRASGGESLAPGVRVQVESSAPAGSNAVDETALRYYARIRDMEKLEAEIRRLKALHPGWNTPTDLFSRTPDSPVDERPVWDLIGDGKFAEARARVAELRGRYPGWAPSQSMLDTLSMGEDRSRLISASDARQWRTVVEIADRYPALISCSSVDSIWRLADARAALGEPAGAMSLYRTIIGTCSSAAERRATIQKAAATLSGTDLDALIALEQTRPHSAAETAALDQVLAGLRRGELAAAMTPASRGGGRRPEVTADTLAAVQADAETRRDSEAALLIGWYLMGQNRAGDADGWFRKAQGWGGGQAALRGRVQALTRQGKAAEAARLARSEGLGGDYVDSMSALLGRNDDPPRAMVVDFARYAEEKRNARAAQALGWWHSRRDDPATAAAWFDNALQWGGGDEAVEGLALGLQASGQTARFQAVEQHYAGRSARLTKFFTGLRGGGGGGGGPATDAYARGDNTGCLMVLDGRMVADPRGGAAMSYAAVAQTDVGQALAGRMPPVLPPASVPAAYGAGYATPTAAWTPGAVPSGEPVYRAGLAGAGAMPSPVAGYGRNATYGYTPETVAMQAAGRLPAPQALTTGNGWSITPGAATMTGGAGIAATGYGAAVPQPVPATLPPVPVEAPGIAMQRAWCLMGLGRPVEAQYAFAQARAGGGEQAADAVYGEILALMQSGLTTEAARLIETQPLSAERRTDIEAELLAARAQDAYDAEDYTLAMRLLDSRRQIAPERRDLALMRAWSLYHTSKGSAARALFQRLDNELSTPESREGLRVVTIFR
ncbi:hypothetical protein GCM10011505_04060 [Tistrella bauzanensis]|uniref:Cellulose synthase n=1 Tax=Tistrella bauzanensis TaxID=657419 RepID=A0ABQ1IAT3_9PROT|nr:hypothetical protein [Tistrella bauzanensis]GGB26023.1 hypothetical protein GCM10011505_04060 [Tistrella bauzanensis]